MTKQDSREEDEVKDVQKTITTVFLEKQEKHDQRVKQDQHEDIKKLLFKHSRNWIHNTILNLLAT